MKSKFLDKLLSHPFFAIGVALGMGVLVMVGLVQVYDYFWGEGPTESVLENPVQKALSDREPAGPITTLNIRKIPGPFLSPEGGEPYGFVFLAVAIEVAGEDHTAAVNDNLDLLFSRFSETLKERGIGRSDLPGEVDYDRLARTFLELARDELGLRGITSITISEDEST